MNTNMQLAISFAAAWGYVWPILVAILAFLIMIFIHEFGHFIAAKAMGVRVNEFSIGFGPTLLKKQGRETLYCIKLLPFGGYCAMEGEDETSDDPKGFCNKKPWRRFIITAAGAVFNILFGFLIMMIVLAPQERYTTTTVASFAEDASSAQSGLAVGDRILSVNGRSVLTTTDLSYTFTNIPDDGRMDMVVRRNGEKVELPEVTFATQNSDGINYVSVDFYVQGVDRTIFTFLSQSVKTTVSYGRMVWWSLIDLLTGKFGISQVSGPVGVTVAIGNAAKLGWDAFLPIITLITVNLGIFNLLPIPALDGGRLFFIMIEMIRRKPIPPKKEGLVHGIGFAVLMIFMALVTFKDIWGLIFK